MELGRYQEKRDFTKTPEPRGVEKHNKKGFSYVIQKHDASRLHYDFRLELDGVLLSWAVPKGPSLDPSVKRLAVQTEDHPVEYGGFEGIIPEGEYGGGTVMVWDRGTWKPEGDPREGVRKGRLTFELYGQKLRGKWHLVRTKAPGKQVTWLLFKGTDSFAREGDDVTERLQKSALTKKSLEEIASKKSRVWHSSQKKTKKDKPARARSAHPRKTDSKPAAKTKTKRATDLPLFVEPELAKLVDQAPDGDDWIHEVKLDGYRILARVDGDDVRLISRNGNDWTDRFSRVAKELQSLALNSTILDGEVVVFDEHGVSDFQALQGSMSDGDSGNAVYCAFDLLYSEGDDLRSLPLESRKEKLAESLEHADRRRIRYSDHVVGGGPRFFEEACKLGLEGAIAKRRLAPYRSGRGGDWLKIKCIARQEFVIGGYTSPKGSRSHLGALFLCGRDKKKAALRYVGKVGTGFTAKSLKELEAALRPLELDKPGFEKAPHGAAVRDAHWVKPELVAEVSYTSFTRDGALRHPSFHGLRRDKPAKDVVLEHTEGRSPRAGDKHHG